MNLQEMYVSLELKMQSLNKDEDYLELEECVHNLCDLKVNAIGSVDPTFGHQLITVQRTLVERVSAKAEQFVRESWFFRNGHVDYFEECEFSAYIRMFKELDLLRILFDKIQEIILKP